MNNLPPIEEAIKNELSKDLYTWIMQNQNKTNLTWHDSRGNLVDFLVKKGWVKEG